MTQNIMTEIRIELDKALEEIDSLVERVKGEDISIIITENGKELGVLIDYVYYQSLLTLMDVTPIKIPA